MYLYFVCLCTIVQLNQKSSFEDSIVFQSEDLGFFCVDNDTCWWRIRNKSGIVSFSIGKGVLVKKGDFYKVNPVSIKRRTAEVNALISKDSDLLIYFRNADGTPMEYTYVTISSESKVLNKLITDKSGVIKLKQKQASRLYSKDCVLSIKSITFESELQWRPGEGMNYVVQSLVKDDLPFTLGGITPKSVKKENQNVVVGYKRNNEVIFSRKKLDCECHELLLN